MKILLAFDYDDAAYAIHYESPLEFYLENATTRIYAADLPPEVANEIAAVLEAVEQQ